MTIERGKRFVAFFDLLGFSSWLEMEGSAEVFDYVRGYLAMMMRASIPGSVVHQDRSVTIHNSQIGFVNFSDSIVFYSRGASERSFRAMLRVCGEFMNSVVMGTSRMLRGAMAYGDFYADSEVNAFVGQALIDAYRLEEMQDWISFSFHPSVVALRHFKRALDEYPTYIVRALEPLKDQRTIPYCLNWVDKGYLPHLLFNAEFSLAQCERKARQALKDNAIELGKLDIRMAHTRRFIRHYNSALELAAPLEFIRAIAGRRLAGLKAAATKARNLETRRGDPSASR